MKAEPACPACHSRLVLTSTEADCPTCRVVYGIENGVLCTDRSDAFLGEFGPERMTNFIRMAREQGWQSAVETMCHENPGVRQLLFSPSRALFLDIPGIPNTGSVMDLGAGLGAISLQLSKSFEQVLSVDLAYERLALLQVMAEQQGIRNIKTICHRDICRLPVAAGSLDAVVMVGVFEYFPLTYPDLPVATVQSRALTEIFRVLAPGGVLFMATKNRFGWPHWAGAVDNSGLKFGSLLPRVLADFVSRRRLHTSYRIVTDSLQAYRAMLIQAGFDDPEFYWPVDGYQSPRSWINLKDRNAVFSMVDASATGLRRHILRQLTALGVIQFFVPHFGIVARKA